MPKQVGRPMRERSEDPRSGERRRERLVSLVNAAQRLTVMAHGAPEFRAHAYIVNDVAADLAAEIAVHDAPLDVARFYRVLFTVTA